MHFAKKLLIASAFICVASPGVFAQDIVSEIAAGCETEIKQYCSQVQQGEGRMLACFYAHEDKLSSNCVGVLYQAAEALTDAVDALEDVAEACGSDIEKFCANVEMGDGRIAQCLEDNANDLSEDCTEELTELAE